MNKIKKYFTNIAIPLILLSTSFKYINAQNTNFEKTFEETKNAIETFDSKNPIVKITSADTLYGLGAVEALTRSKAKLDELTHKNNREYLSFFHKFETQEELPQRFQSFNTLLRKVTKIDYEENLSELEKFSKQYSFILSKLHRNVNISVPENRYSHTLIDLLEGESGVCAEISSGVHSFLSMMGYDSELKEGIIVTKEGELSPHTWIDVCLENSCYSLEPTWSEYPLLINQRNIKYVKDIKK